MYFMFYIQIFTFIDSHLQIFSPTRQHKAPLLFLVKFTKKHATKI